MTIFSLTLSPSASPTRFWAVSRHILSDMPIYLSVDRLEKLTDMLTARKNTAWQTATRNMAGMPITIEVLYITPHKDKAYQWRAEHESVVGQLPCNKMGVQMAQYRRLIYSSDGQRFGTQEEAARVLRVTQAAISKHLAGRQPTVSGVTLSRTPPPTGAPQPPLTNIVPPPPPLPQAWPDITPQQYAEWARQPREYGPDGLALPPPGWTQEQFGAYLKHQLRVRGT